MKSAYELAMERLNKTSPTVKLSADQKKQIGELESKFAAKIAEREIALQTEIDEAAAKGDWEKMEQAKKHLVTERKKLQSDLEEKKEQVRQKK
jgi:hypothetical protein